MTPPTPTSSSPCCLAGVCLQSPSKLTRRGHESVPASHLGDDPRRGESLLWGAGLQSPLQIDVANPNCLDFAVSSYETRDKVISFTSLFSETADGVDSSTVKGARPAKRHSRLLAWCHNFVPQSCLRYSRFFSLFLASLSLARSLSFSLSLVFVDFSPSRPPTFLRHEMCSLSADKATARGCWWSWLTPMPPYTSRLDESCCGVAAIPRGSSRASAIVRLVFFFWILLFHSCPPIMMFERAG